MPSKTTTTGRTTARSTGKSRATKSERQALAEQADVTTSLPGLSLTAEESDVLDMHTALMTTDDIGAVWEQVDAGTERIRLAETRTFRDTLVTRVHVIGAGIHRGYAMAVTALGDKPGDLESLTWSKVQGKLPERYQGERYRIAWKSYRVAELRATFWSDVEHWNEQAERYALDTDFPSAERRYWKPNDADSCLFYFDRLQDGDTAAPAAGEILGRVTKGGSSRSGGGDTAKQAERYETKSERDERVKQERKQADEAKQTEQAAARARADEHVRRVTFLVDPANKAHKVADLVSVKALMAASDEQVEELRAYCASILAHRMATARADEAQQAAADAQSEQAEQAEQSA